MEPREVGQLLATVRLQAALVDHVLAVEEMPAEVCGPCTTSTARRDDAPAREIRQGGTAETPSPQDTGPPAG